ncbi:Fur family transcriptional regulator [Gammaproteobacteria bacterium 53_120_T64]|nr:Fur family transcriptional regulator [Gammaproteobacteria bacterium 53_120_T64]
MISNSTTAYQQHDHHRCLKAALAQARNRCSARKARLTPIRESVLHLLWQSHRPLGAYKIIEQLSAESGKRILPPTVYRALDFLLELGLIHRLATLNAYIGCPFPDSVHSDYFLLCRECGSVAECSAESVNNAIVSTAERAGFLVESQTVEILGVCTPCREKNQQAHSDLAIQQEAGA